MKWIMVANSNDCRIYKFDKNIKNIQLVEEICHPENRLKEQDLVSDSFGHFQNMGMIRGSYEPEFTHVEIAADNFAKEMADKLNSGRIKHLYDGVILLMPSTMGGMLFKHLNKNVLGMVQKSIKKNLIKLSDHELKKYLGKNVRFSGSIH
ncbi:MAG: host attachment protein [Legionellaceae bacterium]|nr:host attachment protein [Legionellaceae bacterium]